jgi:hypothetical protein
MDQFGASPTLSLLKMTQVTQYMRVAFPQLRNGVLGAELPFD